MKTISLLLIGLGLGVMSMAQTLDEAKKLLKYGRLQGAEKAFAKLVEANPNDPESAYWLGQLYLEQVPAKVEQAKSLYSKALTATQQNPLLLVGMGHVELLENNKAGAKIHFDQAIEATSNRKNKKYGDPQILAAIGRANAAGDAQTGDIEYALEKLAQAAEIDKIDADIMVNTGLIHLKRGGEFGGPAKRAFEDAIERDPKYGLPYYRIGKIFQSQRNTALFLDYYNRAVENDPNFAPAYFELYEYYKEKDVNKAKTYLDKFMANNDSDIETEFFYADFLFRSGKYQESLQKGKEIEASLAPGENFPKVYRLYAITYDRLGDSVNARDNMEKYIAKQAKDKLNGDDFAEMAKMYLKFPEQASKADDLVEKAVALDTSVENKMTYMKAIANAYASQNDWKGNYKWLDKIDEINPRRTAVNYFYLADAAFKAGQFDESMKVSAKYISSYPDQIQGYSLQRRAAIAADPDTSNGLALPAIDQYTTYLMNDKESNKFRILENYGYKIYYYLIKSREYDKALQASNAILELDPANDYGIQAKAEAERLIKATGGNVNSSATKVNSSGKPEKTGGTNNR